MAIKSFFIDVFSCYFRWYKSEPTINWARYNAATT
jgi:hypothetical protein